jgi:endonuclease-8
VPEGDALYRAAQRLQVLVGERVAAESPNPRAAVTHIAERIDGRRLESVEAVGKNLFLRFEGNVTLRSHLRMKGRWRVQPAGRQTGNGPWLVLRGATHEAVLWHGPVLELSDRARLRLGPDILAEPPFAARVSPWLQLSEATDDELRDALIAAARLMRARLEGVPPRHRVYRRKRRPCPRCGEPIRSWPLGEGARMAYWCESCQRGDGP